MSTRLKLGEIVPLVAQLECPDSGPYYVRASIKNGAGTVIATRDLVDQGSGEFTDNTYGMPNENFITAQYFVYNDALFTDLSGDFCFNVDAFPLDRSSLNVDAPDIDVTLDQTDQLLIDLDLGEVDVILDQSSDVDVVLDQDQNLLVDFQTNNLEIELEVC